MKKKLKSFLICTVALLTSFVAISCANEFGGKFPETAGFINSGFVSKEKIIASHKAEINKFGSNPVIYDAKPDSARFYNGQHLDKPFWGMYNDITFESNLVKYDSINPDVMKYIENIEENALMHHSYDIEFIKEETYVEFASYIDMANGEVIMCEVRIFKGDYLDTWNRKRKEGIDPWYAKSVTLSPDFSTDIGEGKNILTGKEATYKYPHAIYKGNPVDNTQETNQFKDDLNIDEASYLDGEITNKMKNLGNFVKFYDKSKPNICCNNETCFIISRMFAYNSLSEKAIQKYDTLKNTGWLIWTNYDNAWNEINDDKYRFIELLCYVDRKSNKITSYEIRFKIPNPDSTKWEAKGTSLQPAEFDELTK